MVGSTFNPRPKSINEVVDYVLKRLGVQLLEINVTEEQILDRVADAVSYFQEHHADGTFEGYFKTKIEATTLKISPSVPSASISPSASASPSASDSPSSSSSMSPSASLSPSPSSSLSPSSSPSASASPSAPNVIKVGDTITSATWSAKVYSVNDTQTEIELKDFLPKSPDSTVAQGQIICVNGDDYVIDICTLGTAELGYITIPTNVESILSVAQLPAYNSQNLAVGKWNPNSTWTNQIFHYKGSGLAISFYLQEIRNETLSQLNTLQPWADFNRYMNRAYLNAYDYNKNIGNWIVFRVITAVDPEEYPEMYGDTWFLRYCVELVRRQWGENLSKFDEVALLNGVKVNGEKMMNLADARIKELEEEMFASYRLPDDFFLA